MSDISVFFLSSTSLQKLHREILFLQQQVSYVQHRGPPDATTLQHQVGSFSYQKENAFKLLKVEMDGLVRTVGVIAFSAPFSCRPDRQLQDIVYKMVPFLEECKRGRLHTNSCTRCVVFCEDSNVRTFSATDEKEQMINFYKARGLEVPNPGKIVPLI